MTSPIREIYHGMRAKRWLAAAVIVEALGLLGAIGSIPALGFLPLIWALAIVGIFSTVGVLIVTAHYVWEYNRRPLNDTQRREVQDLISPYLLSVEADSLAPKAELSNFVRNSELFWVWRYQSSVLKFAWASQEIRQPGYVLLGEMRGVDRLTREIAFTVIPPPTRDIGQCLSDLGDIPPELNLEWGNMFDGDRSIVVLYENAKGELKYMPVRPTQKVLFDDRMASPILVSSNVTTDLPVLRKSSESDLWEWVAP